MLYPIQNRHRGLSDVSGLWKFRTDPDETGEQQGWFKGFDSHLSLAIPGSWNEQLEEEGLLHYVGSAWFQRIVFVPMEWKNKAIWLRVGSADFRSTVWVNGQFVGENRLGFLPFEFDISSFVQCGENARIVIRVNNQLSDETIPQGITAEHYANENRLREETFPPARFDFSPFGGIHRPVYLLALAPSRIERIKVDTSIFGTSGHVKVQLQTVMAEGYSYSVVLQTDRVTVKADGVIASERGSIELQIPACRFWSPADPFLYQLVVILSKDGVPCDEYALPVGVREIRIDGVRLLLNNEPIYLTGFGRHEDSCVVGKGLNLPHMVKDFGMMKWINANSFRTSHYPYAEEVMAYADQKGFLVIDEVPAVSLDFRHITQKNLEYHKEYVHRLMERDYNHPCVIMWALGNEPNLVGEKSYYDGRGKAYWSDVFATASAIDSIRPKMVPNCLRAGINDPVLELSDVVAINRYYGWYEYPGQLAFGVQKLDEEIEAIHARYKKPMMMTEFGVDTVPGLHAIADQMFTEEYQSRFLEAYITLLRSKSFVVGEHVWNFADFRTPQNLRRVFLNLKGVFTRARAPKAAAFRLKELWSKPHHRLVNQ